MSNNYQQMSDKLDSLMMELKSGGLDIDEAISKYQEAQKLISKMKKYLEEAENKITKIKAEIE
ncbi:exodeoxyribonuclease VII small subunit [Candidatus Saccharibacteria bacterium]|nr:exodeoxyribonuclease VII small subunit [Candidatus Saccharibacteria bacterium]